MSSIFFDNLPNIAEDISQAADESNQLEDDTDIATEDIRVEVIDMQGAACLRRLPM